MGLGTKDREVNRTDPSLLLLHFTDNKTHAFTLFIFGGFSKESNKPY